MRLLGLAGTLWCVTLALAPCALKIPTPQPNSPIEYIFLSCAYTSLGVAYVWGFGMALSALIKGE